MFKKNYFKTQCNGNSNCKINRSNFIRNRVKIVEKYFPELGKAIYDYIDENAKSRDCIDKLAMILNNYGKTENVTSCVRLQMIDFANVLYDVGTEKDVQVQKMETKVLDELNEHDKLCGLVQMELKLSNIAQEKKRKWLKELERVKQNHPQDSQRISLIEAEVLKARGESVKSSTNLEEHIDIFEKWRLNALKESLLAWTLAELQFHSRALQLFTNAYHIAADIDVNSNIEEFRNKLKSTEDTPSPNSGFRSNSIYQLMCSSFQNKTEVTGSGIPHLCSSINSPQLSSLSYSFQEE